MKLISKLKTELLNPENLAVNVIVVVVALIVYGFIRRSIPVASKLPTV